MEKHMLAIHSVNKNFKCNKCENSFVTEWRLKRHMTMHDKPIKFCHYFNNGKTCKYEELGCKFRHSEAKECRFREACRRKLCEFKHSSLKEKDNQVEQATSIFCENYCEIKKNIHVHTKKSNDYYLGVNLKEMEETKFPCLLCHFVSSTINGHKKHFEDCKIENPNLILTIECFKENCDYECEECTPEEVINHIAEVHIHKDHQIL